MSFRKEIKSIIVKNKLNLLKKWISENNGKILFPQRRINSIYFDNAHLSMYHDSIEGCVPRKKIRIRNYNDLPEFNKGVNNLELKISSAEGRFKKKKEVNDINLRNFKINDDIYGSCRPIICVSYSRIYYNCYKVRLTIDTDIKYRRIFFGQIRDIYFKEPYCVAEIKYNDNSDNKILNKFPFHFVRFSKYCKAIESHY